MANRPMRDNETLFASLSHVSEALAIWKDDYNTIRPHGALGNLPPAVRIGHLVTPSYFSTLGVRPLLGRFFDDRRQPAQTPRPWREV